MKWGFLTICTCLSALVPAASYSATIDVLDIATDSIYETYDPDSYPSARKMRLGGPDIYHLDDGSSWESGAGAFTSHIADVNSTQRDNNIITYSLEAPADGRLWDYTDYNAGLHNSQGVLSLVGDTLQLVAENGSKVATLSGYIEIISDPYSGNTDPRYHAYSADVGDVVPFEIDFTLVDSTTWTETTFGSFFKYTTSGQVDFTSPIPEPMSVAYIFMTLGFLLVRRNLSSATHGTRQLYIHLNKLFSLSYLKSATRLSLPDKFD